MSKEFKDCFSQTDSVKIGEKTYITGKITINDIVLFQKWCEDEARKELITLSDLIGVKPTLKELRSLVIEPEIYDQKSASLEGIIVLFLSVLKRLNKNVDEDYIKNHISVNDIEKISNLISEDIEMEDKKEPENFLPKKKNSKQSSEKSKESNKKV